MRRMRRNITARKALLAFYVLAVVTLGFAHLPLAIPQNDLAAYALPDGTLPIICGAGSGSAPGKQHAGATCDACLLTAAPGLPLKVDLSVDASPTPQNVFAAVAEQTCAQPVKSANARSRAPPLFHA
jgi:hypothetical protein